MKFSVVYLSCIVLVLMAIVSMTDARGIWGAKRRRDEADEVEVESDGETLDGFEASRRKFESRRQNAGSPAARAASRVGSVAPGGGLQMPSRDQIMLAVDAYIDVMESMIGNPEFEKVMTVENIKSIFENFGLSENPEISKLFESDEFSNPEVLKATVIEGIRSMKEYSSQIADMLSDPNQVAALLEQLPEEFKEMAKSLMTGDMSGVKDFITKLPGLNRSQKKMLTAMLDSRSDPSKVGSAVSELLGDPDQVEAARQQMLENPTMAEMMGVPMEVLQDKKKFAELLAEGLEAMSKDGTSFEDQKDLGNLERKFSSKMAAA